MDQTEFETRLRRLVRQAAREDLRIEGCVARSPHREVPDYDVEITELRKQPGNGKRDSGGRYTPWEL